MVHDSQATFITYLAALNYVSESFELVPSLFELILSLAIVHNLMLQPPLKFLESIS